MAKKAVLFVNTRNGANLTPRKFSSITQAVRAGKESMGFYWCVIREEDGKPVRKGFCEKEPLGGYRGI